MRKMNLNTSNSRDTTRLLKVTDVADMLSVSPRTVRSWVYRGLIPSLKINGALRFDRTELEKFIKGGGSVN